MTQRREIFGLFPAGGQGTRISPLPCSKELYPIGFHQAETAGERRPKVVSHYLLEKMKLAGASKSFIVLRPGKWDIPAYFGDGTIVGMPLAYLIMNLSYGTPYTLDQSYPFIQEATILFGFPDIIFQPDDAFIQLLEKQGLTGADIVLGLFPADQPQKMDMVDFDSQGRIRQIVIKPTKTDLKYTWIIAVWTPTFTEYMHKYLVDKLSDDDMGTKEIYVGDVIEAALRSDLNIEKVHFPDGRYVDIGTPEDLIRAVRSNSLD